MGSAAPAPAPASPLTPSLLSSHSSAVWPQSWLTPVTMEAGLTGDTEDHTMEVTLLTVEDMVDMGDMDMARDLQSLSLVMDTLPMVILYGGYGGYSGYGHGATHGSYGGHGYRSYH